MKFLKTTYRKIRKKYHRFKLFYTVNWTKTLYFNFKKFPFDVAKKLPVFFYGSVHFQNLEGEIVINGPISMGMIGFGQDFEARKRYKKLGEISLEGKLVLNGPVHFGKDVFLSVGPEAYCELGYMCTLGSDVKLVCRKKIIIGDWTGVGYESQIIDSNFHPMINSKTGELYPLLSPIILGSHNTLSNRVSIMPNTKTPDYCVIASNSVCGKDYTELGTYILIGGIPAKLIKTDYSRDWENEKVSLKKYKVIV